ncbi:MAG: NAD(P)/FAD-dependent oxidoreductase [Hyphomicrobiaceae bacterium]
MSVDVETIVIGAGVVGLAIARALARDGQDVLVLEQHDLIGSETSSRNSEVIHAGIYYPTDSRRARHCVRGKQLVYDFCGANGVAHHRCEKLIVAVTPDQLPNLDALAKTAANNGVTDLVRLTPDDVQRLEPEVRCVGALLSPSTGVIDSHEFMLALQGHAETNGAQVVLMSQATRLSRTVCDNFAIELGDQDRITCRRLVNSAGLHATALSDTLTYTNGYTPPRTFFAKGQYYALSGKSPFQRHIYPIPRGAWLGLHATVDMGGRCKFGPDIEWIDEIDYEFQPEKLNQFLDFIHAYYPALDVATLHPDYTGIRPKLYREGEPVPDFAIHGPSNHGHDHLVMLFGIESPGLTAALAIAEEVAEILSL